MKFSISYNLAFLCPSPFDVVLTFLTFVKLILSYLPDSILKKTRFKYLVGENILSYIDGFFRDNKPSNQGKCINLIEKKIYKDLAVLICEK